MLIDADESDWSSWNRFAGEFAAHAGAQTVRIDDDGITGDAFYAHVRKVGAAVLASPKRHTAALPPSLGRRPVGEPIPLWTWSLLHRQDDDRVGVHGLVDALLAVARSGDWLTLPTSGGGSHPTTHIERSSVRAPACGGKPGRAHLRDRTWTPGRGGA